MAGTTFKVFFTLVKDGKNHGEGILCEDFASLEDAVKAGENNKVLPECYFKVKEYPTPAFIGGEMDNGKLVYCSRLELIEFEADKELVKYVSSMLFDSNEVVASSKWMMGTEELEIYLEVRGEVSVTYNGTTYHKPSEFPDELKALIMECPDDWELSEDADIYVGLNNWFEYIYDVEGVVCEADVSKMTEEEIKYVMKTIATHYFNNSLEASESVHHEEAIAPLEDLYKVKAYNKETGTFECYVNATDEGKAIIKFHLSQGHKWDYIDARRVETNGFVVKRNVAPDGTCYQVENWNDTYTFIPKNSTIGFYPVCKNHIPNYAVKGSTFRASFSFANEEDMWIAYRKLISGEATMLDYMDYYQDNVVSKEMFLAVVQEV